MNRSSREDMEYMANLEDNFIRHVGYEYTRLLCEELDRDKDKIDAVSVPESLDKWFAHFHKQELRARRRRRSAGKMVTVLKRAAVVILIIVIVNQILVATVEAYRAQFLNTITRIKVKFTQIDLINDDMAEEIIPRDWEGRYYPSYIPEGYVLSDKLYNGGMPVLIYSNNDGGSISFQQIQQNASLRIDTGSGDAVNVTVGEDKEALYLKKDTSSTLIWRREDMIFTLNSDNVSLDILIMIAENVKIKK